KAPKKQQSQDTQQSKTDEHKGSVTPLMETVRNPAPDNAGGQLGPGDIKRTRSSDGGATGRTLSNPAERSTGTKVLAGGSLGNVPAFSDTQQKWEEPQPYGSPAPAPAVQTQQQNALKEPSLIFVRSQVQNQIAASVN